MPENTTKFNPTTDKIAVVVKQFTLLKKSEFFLDRYSEPYIISLAIDEGGSRNPKIDFNILSFPNVKKNDTVSFDGQGHLIYGPANPGSFLSYTILFMESDKDIRELGGIVEEVVQSEATNLGMKAIISANPGYAAIAKILQEVTLQVATFMQKNKDDQLFRRNGTLLRDVTPSYDILRTYVGRNDCIEAHVGIIPLQGSNNLGVQTKVLEL